MNRSMINRIINAEGRTVKHGRYSYRLNIFTGEIYRSLTEDVGRIWIDWEGRRFDAWEVVAHA